MACPIEQSLLTDTLKDAKDAIKAQMGNLDANLSSVPGVLSTNFNSMTDKLTELIPDIGTIPEIPTSLTEQFSELVSTISANPAGIASSLTSISDVFADVPGVDLNDLMGQALASVPGGGDLLGNLPDIPSIDSATIESKIAEVQAGLPEGTTLADFDVCKLVPNVEIASDGTTDVKGPVIVLPKTDPETEPDPPGKKLLSQFFKPGFFDQLTPVDDDVAVAYGDPNIQTISPSGTTVTVSDGQTSEVTTTSGATTTEPRDPDPAGLLEPSIVTKPKKVEKIYTPEVADAVGIFEPLYGKDIFWEWRADKRDGVIKWIPEGYDTLRDYARAWFKYRTAELRRLFDAKTRIQDNLGILDVQDPVAAARARERIERINEQGSIIVDIKQPTVPLFDPE
tara:strand:+ start:903 stop:2090 length:1188 start_codon:yes stop_codon:yes gene_type:complete